MHNLSDEIQSWLQEMTPRLAPNSVDKYRRQLKAFKHSTLDKASVSTWIGELQAKGMGIRSLLGYLNCLKAFAEWLVEKGELEYNPVRVPRWRAPRVERDVFTEAEYQRLLVLAAFKPMLKYLITMGWNTGLRLGDCACLLWESVNPSERYLALIPAKTKRLGKKVIIPYGDEVAAVIGMRNGSKYVNPEAAGNYTWDGHKHLSVDFIKLAKSAGINKTFHSLRHSMVSRLIERGVTAEMISSITGQSIQQIMDYSHPSLDAKRKALGI